MPNDKICVAIVSGAHGVRGLVKLKSLTDPPGALADYAELLDEADAPIKLDLLSSNNGQFIAKIGGLSNRDQATALKGTRLYISRDFLPASSEDEYYHADLIGLMAVNIEGMELGLVTAIHNFGASDILEIAAKIMVPFTKDFVPEINMIERKLIIALQDIS